MSTLSNEEVINIFKQIEILKNDKSKISEINNLQNKIINGLSFLVYDMAKSYRKFPNYEDLVQEGFIGLIKAVRKFDFNKYPNFFMYANQWIKNSIKKSASRFDVVYNPNRKRVVYAEKESDNEEDSSMDLENIFFEKELKIKVQETINELSDRDREIIKKIFGFIDSAPQTLREIGPEFNLTHERVRQIKNNIISKLKNNQILNDLR